LHIVPLNYFELLSRVYSYSGMITNDEEQSNVIEYTLKPMKDAPQWQHKFYTFWIGYFNGIEVLECGYICPPTVDNLIEVFCYTKPEYQKQGFGTEAVSGLVKFASAFDSVHHVLASVAKDNIPSQKMFLKNGFEHLTDMDNGMKIYNLTIKN